MITNDIKPVCVSRRFAFPSALIFDAWIRNEIIGKWLFTGTDRKLISIETNAVPGGSFSIVAMDQHTKQRSNHFGRYLLVNRPNNLEFTLSMPEQFEGESVVSIRLEAIPDGCMLTLTQTGIQPETTENNWISMLENLNKALEKMKAE